MLGGFSVPKGGRLTPTRGHAQGLGHPSFREAGQEWQPMEPAAVAAVVIASRKG